MIFFGAQLVRLALKAKSFPEEFALRQRPPRRITSVQAKIIKTNYFHAHKVLLENARQREKNVKLVEQTHVHISHIISRDMSSFGPSFPVHAK